MSPLRYARMPSSRYFLASFTPRLPAAGTLPVAGALSAFSTGAAASGAAVSFAASGFSGLLGVPISSRSSLGRARPIVSDGCVDIAAAAGAGSRTDTSIACAATRDAFDTYPNNSGRFASHNNKAGSAFDLRLAAAMSSSDGTNETSDAARRRRRRSNSLLLVLAVGFLVFGAAAGALYYALQPVTLRIAVGPQGSDDHKVIQAMAEAFAGESRTVRLSPITTDGAVEALALLGAGKADLAVGRGDLKMPADAQTVAIVRKNFVVLWSPSGPAGKSSKRKA